MRNFTPTGLPDLIFFNILFFKFGIGTLILGNVYPVGWYWSCDCTVCVETATATKLLPPPSIKMSPLPPVLREQPHPPTSITTNYSCFLEKSHSSIQAIRAAYYFKLRCNLSAKLLPWRQVLNSFHAKTAMNM